MVPLEPPEDIHDDVLEEEIALLSELMVLVVEADGPVTQDLVDNALGLRPPATDVTPRDEDPSLRLSE